MVVCVLELMLSAGGLQSTGFLEESKTKTEDPVV